MAVSNGANTSVPFFRSFAQELQAVLEYAAVIDRSGFVLCTTPGFALAKGDIGRMREALAGQSDELSFALTVQGEQYAFVREQSGVVVAESRHAILAMTRSERFLVAGTLEKNRFIPVDALVDALRGVVARFDRAADDAQNE